MYMLEGDVKKVAILGGAHTQLLRDTLFLIYQ